MAEWCSTMWTHHFVYLFMDESLVDSLSWLVWKYSYKHESRSLFDILIILPGDTYARAGFLGWGVPLILGFWDSSVLCFTCPSPGCKRLCLSLHHHRHLTDFHLFSSPREKTLTMLFWMTWNSPCRSGWSQTHRDLPPSASVVLPASLPLLPECWG